MSTDGSATYWAAPKAIRQALCADPNTLEMLFLPGARALDAIGEWLLEERDVARRRRFFTRPRSATSPAASSFGLGAILLS